MIGRMKVFFALLVALALLIVPACGNTPAANRSAPPAPQQPAAQPVSAYDLATGGDPAIGRAIFHGEKKLAGVLPCNTCHYVEKKQGVLVGPNMDGLGERASERVEGQSAEEYLYESIRDPDAYVVEGFPPGTMNQEYGDQLSDENIKHVIAYLKSL